MLGRAMYMTATGTTTRNTVAAAPLPYRARDASTTKPAKATTTAGSPKYAVNQCSDQLKCQLFTASRSARLIGRPAISTGRSLRGSGRQTYAHTNTTVAAALAAANGYLPFANQRPNPGCT
jgi:hypothetical protein